MNVYIFKKDFFRLQKLKSHYQVAMSIGIDCSALEQPFSPDNASPQDSVYWSFKAKFHSFFYSLAIEIEIKPLDFQVLQMRPSSKSLMQFSLNWQCYQQWIYFPLTTIVWPLIKYCKVLRCRIGLILTISAVFC